MWTMSNKYVEFFRRAVDERMWIMQGSRRSGKTTNTFLFMQALSLVCRGQKFTILTYQNEQLKKTIEDFKRVFNKQPKQSKTGLIYVDERNNTFSFEHCDDASKALGNYCDVLFINESVNVPEEIANAYMLGCTQRVILNFNPIHHGWHEKYITDTNLLKTTFKDNEYLNESQVRWFEQLKERAEQDNASALDKFSYTVYYCGEYSELSGAVFTNVSKCTLEEYIDIPTQECLAIDFGFRDGGDATSLVGVKLYNKTIYAHCYLYDNTLERLSDLAGALTDAGVNSQTTVWGDYGGMGKSRMDDLIYQYGFTMCNAVKPKIMDNISRMLSFENGLCVTENSIAMIDELRKYEMINGKLSEKDNHSIDALRYAFNSAIYYT